MCRNQFYVVFRNNVNVEGATHKQVVDLIRSGGDVLTLTGLLIKADTIILVKKCDNSMR